MTRADSTPDTVSGTRTPQRNEYSTVGAGTAQDRRKGTLDDFAVTRRVSTRFADNDVFGHINNAAYYAYFDTAINSWIADITGRQSWELPSLGVVATSRCDYFSEIHFPQDLVIGINVTRLGRKSITYELGVFTADDPTHLRARGEWVHVYIDPRDRRTTAVPPVLRSAIDGISDGRVALT
jgi:acyl-CoA thioester hydrolase